MVGNTFGAPIFVVLLLCFCGSSMLCGCNGDGGSVLCDGGGFCVVQLQCGGGSMLCGAMVVL